MRGRVPADSVGFRQFTGIATVYFATRSCPILLLFAFHFWYVNSVICFLGFPFFAGRGGGREVEAARKLFADVGLGSFPRRKRSRTSRSGARDIQELNEGVWNPIPPFRRSWTLDL